MALTHKSYYEQISMKNGQKVCEKCQFTESQNGTKCPFLVTLLFRNDILDLNTIISIHPTWDFSFCISNIPEPMIVWEAELMSG